MRGRALRPLRAARARPHVTCSHCAVPLCQVSPHPLRRVQRERGRFFLTASTVRTHTAAVCEGARSRQLRGVNDRPCAACSPWCMQPLEHGLQLLLCLLWLSSCCSLLYCLPHCEPVAVASCSAREARWQRCRPVDCQVQDQLVISCMVVAPPFRKARDDITIILSRCPMCLHALGMDVSHW